MSTIKTSVARADFGENRFLGRAVIADLAGRETLASAFAMSVSGRRFSADEAAVVDDVAVCTIAAEPRIWPLKLARIAASYGGPLAGYAAGHVILDGALVGPWSTKLAATLLVEVSAEIGKDDWTDADVDAVIERRFAKGERFPGYGVAFRPEDERVGALERCLARRGRDQRPYWRLMRAVERAICARKKLPANIGAGDAAALLDLGLEPDAIGMLVTACTALSFIPNVMEAAEQKSEALKHLPADRVRYVGREPRLSPRAAAKAALDSKAPLLAESVFR